MFTNLACALFVYPWNDLCRYGRDIQLWHKHSKRFLSVCVPPPWTLGVFQALPPLWGFNLVRTTTLGCAMVGFILKMGMLITVVDVMFEFQIDANDTEWIR